MSASLLHAVSGPASQIFEKHRAPSSDVGPQVSLEAGVQRVVMASSNHAADFYEPLIHSGECAPPSPARRGRAGPGRSRRPRS